MASRTPEGKHVARFIVLKKAVGEEKYTRSVSLPGFYLNRVEAEQAVAAYQLHYPVASYNATYKVRQK